MKGTPHERRLPEALAGYLAMARSEGKSRDYLEAITTAVTGLARFLAETGSSPVIDDIGPDQMRSYIWSEPLKLDTLG